MPYNEKSRKNLKPMWTSESAKEAQRKSTESRMANYEARQKLKMSMSEWKKYKEELGDVGLKGLDVLEILMYKALEAEDHDTAADLANKIAEYQNPKLSRQDVTSVELDATDLSNEELVKRLQDKGLPIPPHLLQ